MNKWFKYILISTITMFIGFNGVDAKRANTCTYNLDSGTITIETDDSKGGALGQYSGGIWRSIFKDVETVYTYKDNKWTSSDCPKYILYKTSGSNKLYGSSKETVLKKLATNKKYKSNSYKIVALGYINSVSVSTISDNDVMTCTYDYGDGEYTFYVDKNNETVSLSDNRSSSCTTKDYPKYKKFKNGCPDNIYKSMKSDLSGNIVCKYSTSNSSGSSSASLSDSTNDTSIDTTKATEDYADSCDDAGETIKLLKQIYNLLRYLIPVLIIGLSIVDFIKVVATGEDKVFKEVWTKFVKRIVIGIVILILPAILSLIINLSGITETYGVDPNNIFCILK